MTDSGPRTSKNIRIVVDRVNMRGMSSRDARRLLDTVQHELAQMAPEIAHAIGLKQNREPVPSVRATPIAASRRIETAGASIAQAIVKAIRP